MSRYSRARRGKLESVGALSVTSWETIGKKGLAVAYTRSAVMRIAGFNWMVKKRMKSTLFYYLFISLLVLWSMSNNAGNSLLTFVYTEWNWDLKRDFG